MQLLREIPFSINRDNKLAIYMQIYFHLKTNIENNKIPEGTLLPNQNELSIFFGVNHITLIKALKILSEDGLIERKAHIGTKVLKKEFWKSNNSSKKIGLVVWNNAWHKEIMSYTKDLFSNIIKEAINHNFEIPVLSIIDQLDFQEKINKQNFHALIAFPPIFKYERDCLLQSKIPIVLLDYKLKDTNIDSILIDSYPGMSEAISDLVEQGHKDIWFWGARITHPDLNLKGVSIRPQEAFNRLEAFIRGMEENNLFYDMKHFIETEYEENEITTIVQKLIKTKSLPSAFVVHDDSLATILKKALSNQNLIIPKDISLVGFGDMLGNRPSRMTTVNIPWHVMASTSIQRIKERLDLKCRTGICITIPTSYAKGTTVRELKA